MVKILCFHGRGQNTEIFKKLLTSLQKSVKNSEWIYIKGFYLLKTGGMGWYKYIDDNEDLSVINDEESQINIKNIQNLIETPSSTVLIGFSEGAQFVLDLSKRYDNIRGVVALSPSYSGGLLEKNIVNRVVIVTSVYDTKLSKKYLEKWKKRIKNFSHLIHTKGHKVYLPLTIRTQIIDDMKL